MNHTQNQTQSQIRQSQVRQSQVRQQGSQQISQQKSQKWYSHFQRLIKKVDQDFGLRADFLQRLNQGKLTKDENPETHYCVFFAGFDPAAKQVFIGHHIKADSWIFNGGHIDPGELPAETVDREMKEEWGEQIGPYQVFGPEMLSVCLIDKPPIPCKKHYDFWYFVQLDKSLFRPDRKLLLKEFHDYGWKSVAQAQQIVERVEAKRGLDRIVERWF